MSIYGYTAKSIREGDVSLERYRGKVLLIVNTASQCGFTNQYADLEKLHEEFGDKGLVILGFPCNQFGQQEPGDEAAIEQFCTTSFGIKFPMFAKVEVNGENAHPLYQFLKSQAPGFLGTKNIKWNFTKFLVSSNGTKIQRFAPTTTPAKLRERILELLKT